MMSVSHEGEHINNSQLWVIYFYRVSPLLQQLFSAIHDALNHSGKH